MPGNQPHHTDKFRRCVEHVIASGKSEDSAYAICTTSLRDSGEEIFEAAEEHMRHLHLHGVTGKTRIEIYRDRKHLVVPVVALMEGVIHAVNAETPEFVPLATLQKAAHTWNGLPVVLGHPKRDGKQCSANHTEVIASHGCGIIRNSRVEGKKMLQEAWIDHEKAQQLHPDMLKRLEDGDPEEVSVGAYVVTDSKPGIYNNKRFQASWMEAYGDHLALLPGGRGACSIEMGCGTHRAAEMHFITAESIESEHDLRMAGKKPVQEDCPVCEGSGNKNGNPCEHCDGMGVVSVAIKTLGGAGSGNFGHAGRPGEIGGSAPDGGGGRSSGGGNDLDAYTQRQVDKQKEYEKTLPPEVVVKHGDTTYVYSGKTGTHDSGAKSWEYTSSENEGDRVWMDAKGKILPDKSEMRYQVKGSMSQGFKVIDTHNNDKVVASPSDRFGANDITAKKNREHYTGSAEPRAKEGAGKPPANRDEWRYQIKGHAYEGFQIVDTHDNDKVVARASDRLGANEHFARRNREYYTGSADGPRAKAKRLEGAASCGCSDAASCGCDKGVKPMEKTTRAELIATLVTDRYSGFQDGDEAILEAASDHRLEAFRAASDIRRSADVAHARLETDHRNTAARLKVAEERLKTAEAPMSEDEFLARAPESFKRTLEARKAEEDQVRASLVSQLKDLGANTEEELKQKSTPDLQNLAKYAGVQVADFSGRGMPVERQASERNTDNYAPPNPYDAGIKAMRTASKAIN